MGLSGPTVCPSIVNSNGETGNGETTTQILNIELIAGNDHKHPNEEVWSLARKDQKLAASSFLEKLIFFNQ